MAQYQYGHWVCDFEVDPESAFGFIYLIKHIKSGRGYVGKKQYYSYRKNKKFKKMDWENYTSSSKELNELISQEGIQAFQFRILRETQTKGGLTYVEANEQHKRDVLTEKLPDGTRAYYNKQIGAIKYVPKEF